MRNSPVILVLAIAAITWALAAGAWSEELPDRPLTLEDCIQIALARNPQITSSEQGIVSAHAGLTRARSSYYPQLSLSVVEGLTSQTSYLSVGGSTVAFGGSKRREDLDLSLRTTFWRRGRRENVAETKTALRAAALRHTSTTQGLIELVSSDYYGVLAAQELLAVADAGVESAQEHVEQVKAFIRFGQTADVDIFPVEDDLARAQLDLIDARSSVRTAIARLKNSMGLPARAEVGLAEAPPPTAEPIPSLQDAAEIALQNRPDLLADQAALQGSRYALAQTKIRRGPGIDVTGQYLQGYTDWQSRDPSWNVSLGLSWPLFDGQATQADERAARASAVRSQADVQRLINQIALDVENALVEVERTDERRAATAKSVAAAEARLGAAEGKYQEGVGILLEVIDARAAVTSAHANQVGARYNYQISLVGLQRVMGTLPIPTIARRQGEEASSD